MKLHFLCPEHGPGPSAELCSNLQLRGFNKETIGKKKKKKKNMEPGGINILAKYLTVSCIVKHTLCLQPSNPIPRYLPKRDKKIGPQKIPE